MTPSRQFVGNIYYRLGASALFTHTFWGGEKRSASVFEELRRLGYEGGYDSVRRYAKAWRVARGAAIAEAYVPLSFAPGEVYQFDWSHEIVLINGVTVTVKVAHVRALGRDTRDTYARVRRVFTMW
jgi:hypothetical protein